MKRFQMAIVVLSLAGLGQVVGCGGDSGGSDNGGSSGSSAGHGGGSGGSSSSGGSGGSSSSGGSGGSSSSGGSGGSSTAGSGGSAGSSTAGSGGSAAGAGGKAGGGGATAGAGGATGGAGGATGGAGGATGGAGGAAAVHFDSDIYTITKAKCSPCHVMGNHPNFASGTLNTAYNATQANAGDQRCNGKKVYECMLTLVKSGAMPDNKGCKGDPTMDAANANCLTKAQLDALQAWVTAGAPK
jgi:hypothetical protein